MSRLESLLVKILKPIIRNERTRYRLNLTWRKWSQMGGNDKKPNSFEKIL